MVIRWWILGALSLWLTPVLAVGAGGLGLSPAAAIAAALVIAVLIATPASRVVAGRLHTERPLPGALHLAMAAAAVLAVLQIGSVSLFMADATRTRFSVDPDDQFRRVHSCVSAYAEAARFLAEGGHNIYERSLYRQANGFRELGPLRVDPYHYPPPFLLLPQAVRALAPDFWDFRRLWFTLQAVVLAGALVGLAAWVGGRRGVFALLGGLIMLALPHPVATLQQGNFQITAVPLAILGFVLLMTGRPASGGGMFAYAAIAKIFPGILLVPLVTGRRWRQVAWLAAMGSAVAALAVLTQGVQPARDFISTSLPELSSGAAFPQTEMGPHSRVNWSAYGQTVRLRQLGVAWLTQSRGLMVAQVYGLLVVALAAWAGWRARFDVEVPQRRLDVLMFGLGLIGLASFRSPFVGGIYGIVSTLWVVSLLAARATSTGGVVSWLAALGALGGITWLVPSPAVPLSVPWIWITGLLVLACMAVNVWAVVAAVRPSAHTTSQRSSTESVIAVTQGTRESVW